MSYRYDRDLEFLGQCKDEDLKALYDILVYDPKDNEKWISETLSISEEHKMYGKKFSRYWERIAEELQLQGGNSIVNIFRLGDGVLYKEILEDVAEKLKVFKYSGDTAEEIEDRIIEDVMSKFFREMPSEQISELMSDISPEEYQKLIKQYGGVKNIPWGKIGVSTARQILKMGGFATYKFTLVAVNLMWKKLFGKGLTLLANSTLTKVMGSLLSGPVAILLNTWLIFDIASPAFRITAPAVMIVALLRKKVRLDNECSSEI